MVYCTLAQTGEYGKWQAIGQGVFVESHDRALVEQVGREQGCTYNVPEPEKLCCPSGWSYDGQTCMSQSGEDAEPPHLCSLGGVPLDDAPAPYYPPIKPIPYERPEATCEERGDCPPIPQPQPIDNNLCPRGEKYTALFSDCDEGYIPFMVPSILPGLSSNVCVCSVSGKGKELIDKGYAEEWSLSKIMNYLPMIIIAFIVINLIGVLKR